MHLCISTVTGIWKRHSVRIVNVDSVGVVNVDSVVNAVHSEWCVVAAVVDLQTTATGCSGVVLHFG